MVYCTNCGEEIKDGAIRCINCGELRVTDGNPPLGKKPDSKIRSFKYSFLFYFIVITDMIISVLCGWALFSLYSDQSTTSYHNSVVIFWVIILLINIIIDFTLLNYRRFSPQTIDIHSCWIKCIFGFIGIFTMISGFYFLIICLLNLRTVPTSTVPITTPKTTDSTFDKYWYNKGIEFSEANNFNDALDAYNQSLAINSQAPEVWNNKCYVLIKLGRYEEAIEAGIVGTDLAPDDPVIWDTLRNAYLANHNPEKAAECENQIESLRHGSPKKKTTPLTTTDGKFVGICCGLLILFVCIIALLNNLKWVQNNVYSLVYIIGFTCLLIGILYEGRKAISNE